MIRALLIYAIIIVAALFAVTLALGVPLEWVAWTALVVEIVPLATWGGVKLARYMAREARQEWTYTRPQSRLPVTRVTAEIVTPAPRIRTETPALLEAPGRELVP